MRSAMRLHWVGGRGPDDRVEPAGESWSVDSESLPTGERPGLRSGSAGSGYGGAV